MENNSFLCKNIFLINQTINWIFKTLLFEIQFVTIWFNYFFYSKFFLICFLHIFSIKHSIIFSALRSLITYVHITQLRKLLQTNLEHNLFPKCYFFWHFYMVTNFKFRIFLIILFMKINVCARLYINKLHFDCAMICIVSFINYIIKFIETQIFWY